MIQSIKQICLLLGSMFLVTSGLPVKRESSNILDLDANNNYAAGSLSNIYDYAYPQYALGYGYYDADARIQTSPLYFNDDVVDLTLGKFNFGFREYNPQPFARTPYVNRLFGNYY